MTPVRKSPASRYRREVERTKRALLVQALQQFPTMREAAKWLGVSASTVCRDCQVYGVSVQHSSRVVVGA